ncbi:MAG TPA: DMT family transporter [bacterium]|nr:DMT family transporter [bacterium]
MKTTFLTLAALLCFAANSLLGRAALGGGFSDAATYTAVRLASGALTLFLVLSTGKVRESRPPQFDPLSALALFAYAAGFSFAYLRLTAGTGAVLLFGAVQATMIGWGLASGEKWRPREAAGLLLALGGVGLMTFPGITAPDPWGAGLMVLAGVAWGAYSLRGRSAGGPIHRTAFNFYGSLPLAAVLFLACRGKIHATAEGLALAALSGALASGAGYCFWYAALPRLTAFRAAVVQLATPLLAALGGILLLGEPAGWRVFTSGAAIAAGVLLAVSRPKAK